MSLNCTKTVLCQECKSSRYCSAIHIRDSEKQFPSDAHEKQHTSNSHGGKQTQGNNTVASNCMEICNGEFEGESCAIIIQVYISKSDNPEKRLKEYVMFDEQNNRMVARKKN